MYIDYKEMNAPNSYKLFGEVSKDIYKIDEEIQKRNIQNENDQQVIITKSSFSHKKTTHKNEDNQKEGELDKNENSYNLNNSFDDTIKYDEIVETFNRNISDKNNYDGVKQIILNYLIKIDPIILVKKLVEEKQGELVKFIFYNFAFEDKDVYNSAFFKIIETNFFSLFQYFLHYNVIEIEDFRDEDGNTALHLSVIFGHLLISKVLISYNFSLIYEKNNVRFNYFRKILMF